MVDDAGVREQEMETRGRKQLGKRERKDNKDDVDMESDDDSSEQDPNEMAKGLRGSLSKKNRSMSASQRKTSVQKMRRDSVAGRREGSSPKRLAYKPVPDEHERLRKKINAVFKHKI